MAIVNVGSVVATGESFVHISNTATQPVSVRVVETPWQTQLSIPTTTQGGTAVATFSVPTGKRLTIEFVSAPTVNSPTQPAIITLTITTTVGGSTATYLGLGQNPGFY
jgi:hypothetical protein